MKRPRSKGKKFETDTKKNPDKRDLEVLIVPPF